MINLGEARTVELRELIQLLERELGQRAVIDRQPEQPGDVPQTFADIRKARQLLGYNPQTEIETGIRRFVEWFNKEQKSEARSQKSGERTKAVSASHSEF